MLNNTIPINVDTSSLRFVSLADDDVYATLSPAQQRLLKLLAREMPRSLQNTPIPNILRYLLRISDIPQEIVQSVVERVHQNIPEARMIEKLRKEANSPLYRFSGVPALMNATQLYPAFFLRYTPEQLYQTFKGIINNREFAHISAKARRIAREQQITDEQATIMVFWATIMPNVPFPQKYMPTPQPETSASDITIRKGNEDVKLLLQRHKWSIKNEGIEKSTIYDHTNKLRGTVLWGKQLGNYTLTDENNKELYKGRNDLTQAIATFFLPPEAHPTLVLNSSESIVVAPARTYIPPKHYVPTEREIQQIQKEVQQSEPLPDDDTEQPITVQRTGTSANGTTKKTTEQVSVAQYAVGVAPSADERFTRNAVGTRQEAQQTQQQPLQPDDYIALKREGEYDTSVQPLSLLRVLRVLEGTKTDEYRRIEASRQPPILNDSTPIVVELLQSKKDGKISMSGTARYEKVNDFIERTEKYIHDNSSELFLNEYQATKMQNKLLLWLDEEQQLRIYAPYNQKLHTELRKVLPSIRFTASSVTHEAAYWMFPADVPEASDVFDILELLFLKRKTLYKLRIELQSNPQGIVIDGNVILLPEQGKWLFTHNVSTRYRVLNHNLTFTGTAQYPLVSGEVELLAEIADTQRIFPTPSSITEIAESDRPKEFPLKDNLNNSLKDTLHGYRPIPQPEIVHDYIADRIKNEILDTTDLLQDVAEHIVDASSDDYSTDYTTSYDLTTPLGDTCLFPTKEEFAKRIRQFQRLSQQQTPQQQAPVYSDPSYVPTTALSDGNSGKNLDEQADDNLDENSDVHKELSYEEQREQKTKINSENATEEEYETPFAINAKWFSGVMLSRLPLQAKYEELRQEYHPSINVKNIDAKDIWREIEAEYATIIEQLKERGAKTIHPQRFSDAQKHRPVPIRLSQRWHSFFGGLETRFSMLVWGKKGSQKSTFGLRFADDFQRYNKGNVVIFLSEERVQSATFKRRCEYSGFRNNNIELIEVNDYDKMMTALDLKPYSLCVIDSISRIRDFKVENEELTLRDKYPQTNIIYINHADKQGKTYKGKSEAGHDVDVEMMVDNGICECVKNRFGQTGLQMKVM